MENLILLRYYYNNDYNLKKNGTNFRTKLNLKIGAKNERHEKENFTPGLHFDIN